MTDGERLLRAILDQPEEDTPRLLYADWLEESGESEWAEFIRVQCELKRLGPPCYGVGHECERCSRLKRAERHWLETNRQGLQAAHPPFMVGLLRQGWDESVPALKFCRGFIESVECPLAAFTEDVALALFSAHPVTAVRLSDRVPVRVANEHGKFPLWGWFREHEPVDAASDLPSVLFDLLSGGTPNAGRWCRWYATRNASLSALSAAATNWGRGLVGLSPLAAAE